MVGDGYHSLRIPRHVNQDFVLSKASSIELHQYEASPTVPARNPSRSKQFFLRVFPKYTDSSSKLKHSESTLSKNTLIRRMSLRRDVSYSSYDSSCDDSNYSTFTARSYQPEDLVLYHGPNEESHVGSHASPGHARAKRQSQSTDILYPHIMVTPEVSTIEAGTSLLWVAITVTGILQAADGKSHFDVDRVAEELPKISGLCICHHDRPLLISCRLSAIRQATFHANRSPPWSGMHCA